MQAKQIIEAFKTLDALEANGSRLMKEELLTTNKDNKALQQLLYWAYSPDKYYTYPSVMYRNETIEAPKALDKKFLVSNWEKFADLLGKLVRRELTGNAAQEATDELLNNSYWWEIKWFGRAMSHDLKAGFGSRTINKIWDPKFFWSKGTNVALTGAVTPSEDVAFPGTMLCAKYSAWNGFGTRFVEPKLDGYRLCLILCNGEYSFYTRSGRCDPYNANLKHIVDQLHAAGIDNVMLDAEVMHETWNKTGLIKHKRPTAAALQEIKEKIVLYVFDMVDWSIETGHQVKLETRKKNLVKLLGVEKTTDWSWPTKISGVRVLSWADVSSAKELDEFYAKCLEQGHEGVVIKDPIGEYNFTGRRTSSWLKHKPLETVDAQIVGFETGSIGTKNEDRLGAMRVKTADGMYFKIGIGFKDHERDSFWASQKTMMGQWVEAKYQKDNVADGRFGRFMRMRDDLNA